MIELGLGDFPPPRPPSRAQLAAIAVIAAIEVWVIYRATFGWPL